MRSVFAPVLLPAAALIAALVRWALQGSGNVYTALDKRFYVPDPDLGWRVSRAQPIWLGLDACAVILAIVVGLAIGLWLLRKLAARRPRVAVLRHAAWVVAAAPAIAPLAAFASGWAPAGARDTLPPASAVAIESGIMGALAMPAGRYAVVDHEGSAISARVSAGGEAFDARFTGAAGALELDPRALDGALAAEISVASASIDTGIGQRSKHARDAYLRAAEHPRVTFTLDRLVAARQATPASVAFRARGTLALIGRSHEVEVTGTLSQPDPAARARLGVSGAILIVVAQLAIPIRDTALAPDAGDFDGELLPIQVSLVLRHASAEPHPGA